MKPGNLAPVLAQTGTLQTHWGQVRENISATIGLYNLKFSF